MKDKYDIAAELRQKVLDMANELGVIETVIVSERLGINLDHANRTMRKMQANEELKRVGRKGARILFSPTKTVTKSAELMRAHAHNKISNGLLENSAKVRSLQKSNEPWRYVNNPEDRGPGKISGIYKNQGGQGAIRREVGIQASMGLV